VDRGTLLFALCHGFRHVDGVPYDDGMGHQIEAPGLLDQFVATCAPQVSPFCLKFARCCLCSNACGTPALRQEASGLGHEC
jgi:hypothetical protein